MADQDMSAFNPAAPPPPEEKIGLFGRIMGQKHQRNLRRESNAVNWIMDQLKNAAEHPGLLDPDTEDFLISSASKYMGPEMGGPLKQHFEQLRAKRDVERRQALLPGAKPATETAAPAAASPAEAPNGAFSPMQKSQLLQMALQAHMQAQQPNPQSGPSDTARAPAPTPPGLPTPPVPFGEGAAAGPAPAQANPVVAEMRAGSIGGQIGFGGPKVTPAPPPAGGPPLATGHWFRSPAQQGYSIGEKQAATDQAEIEMMRRMYGNDPRIKELTEAQQLQFETKRPITPAPHFNIPGITMSTANHVDKFGKPVPVGIPGRESYVNGQLVFTPQTGRLGKREKVNPDGTRTVQFIDMFSGNVVHPSQTMPEELTSAPTLVFKKVTFGDGTTMEVGVNPVTGQMASADPRLRGVNPAMLLTQSNHFKLITNFDGSTDLVPVTETTGKVAPPGLPLPPGAPAPAAVPGAAPPAPAPAAGAPGAAPPVYAPAGGAPPAPVRPGARGASVGAIRFPAGGRPMTPDEIINKEAQAEQLNNTIGVIKGLQRDAPLLANLVTAGKIALQADPHTGMIHSVVNKLMPMSPEEETLASNWSMMTEGIMQMRIPMGGAGFRGKEGFDAMEALKGTLSQRVGVLTKILNGTLREFRAQRDPLVRNATKYGYRVLPEYDADFQHGPESAPAPGGGRGGAPRTLTPPPETRYTWTGSDGRPRSGVIPKAMEAEFLRDHPEAKAAAGGR